MTSLKFIIKERRLKESNNNDFDDPNSYHDHSYLDDSEFPEQDWREDWYMSDRITKELNSVSFEWKEISINFDFNILNLFLNQTKSSSQEFIIEVISLLKSIDPKDNSKDLEFPHKFFRTYNQVDIQMAINIAKRYQAEHRLVKIFTNNLVYWEDETSEGMIKTYNIKLLSINDSELKMYRRFNGSKSAYDWK